MTIDSTRGMEHYTKANSIGTLKRTYRPASDFIAEEYEVLDSTISYYFFKYKLMKIEIFDGISLKEIRVK